jgi:uncharacterized phage protein gp47/JayE
VFEDITAESIKQNILDAMQTDIDKREGSYTGDMVAPVATELWKVYDAMNALLPIAFVDETSGEYIDKRAAEVGITRKAGTKAHAELTLTGTAGTVVPAGTVFLTPDGLEYETDADAVLDSSGTAVVTVNAAEVGEAYNVPAGSITNQYNSLAGLSSVTNQAAAVGGTDPETDESLVNRYYAYLQKPAISGNAHHYEQWALEVDGVGAVKVTPLQNGPGTVGVLIAGPEKQPVDSEIVAACAAHIEENRPIGATVTVESAKGLTIDVSATVTIESSTTKETVQAALYEAVEKYLESIAFENYTVLYNHIAYLLLGTDGVIDYTALTVNGGTANISIADDEVPVLGTVTVL